MTDIPIGATILLGAAALSARWTWWRRRTGGLPVLAYHKIGICPKGSKLKELWVSPEKFGKQLAYLKRRGYNTLLFSDLEKARTGRGSLPENPVLLTFDDGYENNYTYAYKILKEYGAKGNIFLVYNAIGKYNFWHDPYGEPWINMAAPEMLKEMLSSGVMEFGSHTMNHPDLTSVPAEEAEWEIRESKKQLEAAFGAGITAFAYPYGAGARLPALRDKVLGAGYTLDFSFHQGKTEWPWDSGGGPLDRLFIRGDENNIDLYLHLTRGANRLI